MLALGKALEFNDHVDSWRLEPASSKGFNGQHIALFESTKEFNGQHHHMIAFLNHFPTPVGVSQSCNVTEALHDRNFNPTFLWATHTNCAHVCMSKLQSNVVEDNTNYAHVYIGKFQSNVVEDSTNCAHVYISKFQSNVVEDNTNCAHVYISKLQSNVVEGNTNCAQVCISEHTWHRCLHGQSLMSADPQQPEACLDKCAPDTHTHTPHLSTQMHTQTQVRSISYYANRYGGILLPGGHELNVSAIERVFQVCVFVYPDAQQSHCVGNRASIMREMRFQSAHIDLL
eukprot:scaffold14480_cov19-Tisochrysis_lutea.AAC.1